MRALALAVLLAGCGGTSWSKAQGTVAPEPTVPATTPAKSTPSVAVAEKPYVDAMVVSAMSAGNQGNLTTSNWRCVASALVHGFGASTFAAKGLTPDALRRTDSSLDALPEPTDAQISTIGAGLQGCGVGMVLAKSFATGLQLTDPAAVTCFTGRFDADPAMRRFVVTTWLGRKITLRTAHDVVGLVAACIDLPDFILQRGSFPTATRACLESVLTAADAEVKDYFALLVSGADHDTVQHALQALLVSMSRCRGSANTSGTSAGG